VLTAFDVLLIAAAVLVMLASVSGKLSMLWSARRGEDRKGDWTGLVKYLIRQDPILKRRFVGILHLFLFWGCVVFLLVAVLAQFSITMPLYPSLLLSALLELFGILMLIGTFFFLVRRFINRDSRAPERTVLPLAVMLIILVTGFMAQGARLGIMERGFSWVSPVGSLLSGAIPASPLFMQIMIRIHFFAVLIFLAVLPFTAMRHLVFASANVLYRRQTRRGELALVPLDASAYGAGTVLDLTWKQMLDAEACVSCGRCEENCPAFLSGKALSPRKVMRGILQQLAAANKGEGSPGDGSLPLLESAVSGDEIWACTTCMACVQHCPIFVEPMGEIIDMRRYRVMNQGLLPSEARPMLRDLKLYGDVQGKGVARRKDWALNREVPVMSGKTFAEVLLWVGCSGAFHPGNQETARAMAKILNSSGVHFAILGSKERCCGDPARRLGDEALFLDLARENIRWLNGFGVSKIVTLCPHCMHTLKNEYPAIGGHYEVIHAAEYVADLVRQGRISLKYPNEKKIAVQDPCYLGRYNGIYEPIREICKSVPGMEVKELARNRENSFCCGGGGGRMWLHENAGASINKIRAEEALGTGVDVIATACPYCLTMLEDGIKSIEAENHPKVIDVIDIVADSIEHKVNVKDPYDGEE
jgi:Fe-S oxidoreductase/nitrate reductase gamma subunit